MRAIKYLINLSGTVALLFGLALSYSMIVTIPNEERVIDLIKINGERFAIWTLIFMAVITIINLLFERKLEKRKTSREFLFLALIHLLVLTLGFIWISDDFHHSYLTNPEYY